LKMNGQRQLKLVFQTPYIWSILSEGLVLSCITEGVDIMVCVGIRCFTL
jgi:hypothetical protein